MFHIIFNIACLFIYILYKMNIYFSCYDLFNHNNSIRFYDFIYFLFEIIFIIILINCIPLIKCNSQFLNLNSLNDKASLLILLFQVKIIDIRYQKENIFFYTLRNY